jgi:hypothetical protein
MRPESSYPSSNVSQGQPRTFLAHGDNNLGFVAVSYIAAVEDTRYFSDPKNSMQLTTFV